MTRRDEVMAMAEEAFASRKACPEWFADAAPCFERFADLVSAAKQEQCAKVCDEMVLYAGLDCAEAIRALNDEVGE